MHNFWGLIATYFLLLYEILYATTITKKGKVGPFICCTLDRYQWRTEGVCVCVCVVFGGVQTPSPPEIPKALQNRAKLNLIVKTVKNF